MSIDKKQYDNEMVVQSLDPHQGPFCRDVALRRIALEDMAPVTSPREDELCVVKVQLTDRNEIWRIIINLYQECEECNVTTLHVKERVTNNEGTGVSEECMECRTKTNWNSL